MLGRQRVLPIPAATLEEQRRIASVLGALDDLIELTGHS
jgi:restriction endonuclease S subunit